MSANEIASTPTPAISSGLKAVVAGSGAFGLLLGVWISLSASPVVTTVLPLLFGVVGGAGGLKISNFDSSSAKSQLELRLIFSAICSLSLSCILGMFLSPVGYTWLTDKFSYSEPHANITHFDVKNPLHDRPLTALLLRARLETLGASPDEVSAILAAAPKPAPGPWKAYCHDASAINDSPPKPAAAPDGRSLPTPTACDDVETLDDWISTLDTAISALPATAPKDEDVAEPEKPPTLHRHARHHGDDHPFAK